MAEVTDILERLSKGETPLKKDLELVGQAAAGVRVEFFQEVSKMIGDPLRGIPGELVPRTPAFAAFKGCMESMGNLLGKYGLVSIDEMARIFAILEEIER